MLALEDSNNWHIREKKLPPFMILKFILVGLIIGGGALYSAQEEDVNQDPEHIQIIPNSPYVARWTCSRCNYENYDDIGYCSLCGHSKPHLKSAENELEKRIMSSIVQMNIYWRCPACGHEELDEVDYLPGPVFIKR